MSGHGEFCHAEGHGIARFTVMGKITSVKKKIQFGGEDAKREAPKLMGISLSMTGNTPTTV